MLHPRSVRNLSDLSSSSATVIWNEQKRGPQSRPANVLNETPQGRALRSAPFDYHKFLAWDCALGGNTLYIFVVVPEPLSCDLLIFR